MSARGSSRVRCTSGLATWDLGYDEEEEEEETEFGKLTLCLFGLGLGSVQHRELRTPDGDDCPRLRLETGRVCSRAG